VGVRFSAHVQTGPGAHPAYYMMGTRSFPGVKRLGRGVDHPLPSSAEVKESVELYLYSTSVPTWPVLGWTLPLPYRYLTSVLLISVSVWSSRWPSVCASDLLYCVASQHSSYLV